MAHFERMIRWCVDESTDDAGRGARTHATSLEMSRKTCEQDRGKRKKTYIERVSGGRGGRKGEGEVTCHRQERAIAQSKKKKAESGKKRRKTQRHEVERGGGRGKGEPGEGGGEGGLPGERGSDREYRLRTEQRDDREDKRKGERSRNMKRYEESERRGNWSRAWGVGAESATARRMW